MKNVIVPQYVLKVYQSSRQLSYTFAFYNGFCKVCEKKNPIPPSPLKAKRRKKTQEIKPNFEGLYFTIALSNLAQIWYVG